MTKREAQAVIYTLRNFVEKCENIEESVFCAIFKLQNIIEKSNDKKLIQKSISNYFSKSIIKNFLFFVLFKFFNNY